MKAVALWGDSMYLEKFVEAEPPVLVPTSTLPLTPELPIL